MNKHDSRQLVRVAFEAALEKKAVDVLALDLGQLLYVTDYFVLATGSNERQVRAIADEIEKQLHERCRLKPQHREGEQDAQWILLDYIDIVIHLFQPDYRNEYRLEALWAQAERLRAEGEECVQSGATSLSATGDPTTRGGVFENSAGMETAVSTEEESVR